MELGRITAEGTIDELTRKSAKYKMVVTPIDDSLVAARDLIAKGLKAGDWIREAAKVTGGGGGGSTRGGGGSTRPRAI